MPDTKKVRLSRRGVAWAAALISLFLLAGFLLLPLAARPLLVNVLQDKLQRPVQLESLRFNPLTLTATARGFSLLEAEGGKPFLSAQELQVNLQARSVWEGAPVIEEIQLLRPQVNIVRLQDGSYNFSDLIALFSKPSDSPPARYALNNIQLREGRIDFEDQPTKARHVVSDLSLAIPFLSNLPYATDIYVKPDLSAKVNGAPLHLAGQSRPFSANRDTALQLELSQLDLPAYLKYSPVPLNFSLKSGKLDTRLALAFQQPANGSAPMVKLSGTADLHDVQTHESGGQPLLSFKRLAVELGGAELASRHVQLKTILLEAPDLALRRDRNGRLNVAQLVGNAPSPATRPASAPAAAPTKPWQISAGELRITQGQLGWNDLLPARAFQTRFKDLALQVKGFTTEPGKPFSLDLSAVSDAGESLRHDGELRLQPFSAKGNASIGKLDLKRYAGYYADAAGMEATAGVLDLQTRYDINTAGDLSLVLNELGGNLDGVRVKRRGDPAEFLRVGKLALAGGELDLAKRSITVDMLSTRDGNLALALNPDGSLAMTSAEAAGGRKKSADGKKKNADATAAATPKGAASKASGNAAAGEWQFLVKKMELDAWAARMQSGTDARGKLAADGIRLRAANLSNRKGSVAKLDLQARLGKSGHLRADGSVALQPMDVNLKLDAKGLALVPLQPWFTDRINLTLTDGSASARGLLRLTTRSGASSFGFSGDARVDRLTTIDKESAEEFLKWRSLRVRQVNVANEPTLKLSIGEVQLADFYTRLVINRDGSLNYQDVLARDDQPQPMSPDTGTARAQPVNRGSAASAAARTDAPTSVGQAPAAAKAPTVSIARFNLQGGHVDFRDNFIQPNYSAELTQLAGSVTGLSSDPGMLADVMVKGRVENQGQLDITGKINPLSGNLFLDLLARLSDFELSPLTPYAAKYAGYGIEKGKMSFDVRYKVENRSLSAENRLVLNQLTFGEKVDSPTATKLPVLLAVALLKDRNGNIDLDLPISGSLDDPQFSVGGIIVKAIFNLIGRAITAPFSLIGRMFSGGDEASHIAFASGSSHFQPDAENKLKSLARALSDRPNLKLDIAGRAQAGHDTEGLKRAALQHKLKVLKMKDLVKQGESVAGVDEVDITAAEYPKYVAALYAQEKLPGKPRNLIGMAKSIPVPEMESLLLQSITVSDEDLRQLANRRALEVKDFLVKAGPVESERLYIVSGRSEQQQGQQQAALPPARVDFVLGAR